MFKVLLAALAAATVSFQACAANSDDYAPEFRAYTSFSFGAPQAKSLGLHYGLRLDSDSRISHLNSFDKVAVMQLDFSQQSGFESARLYGMPLTTPSLMLNAAGETSVATKMLWFGGLFVVGGAVYGIHEATHNDDPAPAPAPVCVVPTLTLNVACPD